VRDAMLESPYARARCHRLRTYTTQDDVEDAQLARLPIPRTLLLPKLGAPSRHDFCWP